MATPSAETVEEADVVGRVLSAQGLHATVPTVEEALTRTAGVSGAIPSCLLSLAIRVAAFEPALLDRAIEDDRAVVRVPAMRGALYLLPARHVGDGLALSKPEQFRLALRRAGVAEETYTSLAESVQSALSGKRLTGAEVRKALGSETVARTLPRGTFSFFLRGLSHEGRILRVGVRGGSLSQTFEYALMDEWLDAPLHVPDESDALARLLPFYLEAHGPSSLRDVAWWAGASQKVARTALEKVVTREVRLPGHEDALFLTESALNALAPLERGTVILLPHWDAYLMAHADRSRDIPPRWKDQVVDKGGNTTNVILRRGRAVGVWDYSAGALAYATFEVPLNRGALVGASRPLHPVLGDLPVVRRKRAPNLRAGGQNAFRAPLREHGTAGEDGNRE